LREWPSTFDGRGQNYKTWREAPRRKRGFDFLREAIGQASEAKPFSSAARHGAGNRHGYVDALAEFQKRRKTKNIEKHLPDFRPGPAILSWRQAMRVNVPAGTMANWSKAVQTVFSKNQ
jgi:hypothetical protein